MNRRLVAGSVLLCVGLLGSIRPAVAGGWAVVTLDELPGQVVAKQSFSVTFMIRQHGRTPTSDDGATLVFRRESDGQVHTFEAQPQRERGHFSASVVLPSAGQWRWHIDTWGMQHPMPALTVHAHVSSTLAQNAVAESATIQWSAIVGLIGLIVLAGSTWVWFRRRARLAGVVAMVAILVTGGAIALSVIGTVEAANAAALARQAATARQRTEATQQVAVGHDLFIAKGCSTCHQHKAIAERTDFYWDGAPTLSDRPMDPTYLRTWLKDPAAIKPSTEMPNLGLKQVEIEALTAFLTQ